MTTLPPNLTRSFEHAAALAHYDQAIARLEHRFGASHPTLPGLHRSAAEELVRLGYYPQAVVRAERAIALYTIGGGDHEALDQARVVLARARGGANF